MLTPREQRRAAPMAAASSLPGPAADSQLCRSTHAQMTSSSTIYFYYYIIRIVTLVG